MLLRASVVGLCVSTQWNKLEIIIDKEGHHYVIMRPHEESEIRREGEGDQTDFDKLKCECS